MFSLASVATMSICIFLFGLFFCVVQNFQYMVKEVESGVSVTVFFDEAVSFDQAAMDEIGAKIRARDEVEEAEFVSADQHGKNISIFTLQRLRSLQTDLPTTTLWLSRLIM